MIVRNSIPLAGCGCFSRPGVAAVALSLAVLAGCAPAPVPSGINDPLEPANRAVHSVNKGLDRVLVGPGAKAYGSVVPEPVRQGIKNAADTLDLPGSIANDLLQGNVQDAGSNFARLAVNVVFGLGLLDVATDAGIPRADTDFGETLHVWGVGEGPYVELPVFGPSTARDALGTLVDLALNPMGQVTEGRDATAVMVAKILAKLDDRARYSNTVESILYDSADSYAQARLLYLQNRRFELGQTSAAGDGSEDSGFIDPYEDPYAQ
ncbi:MAG: VacJ family lipoprotein [Fuscovulum sp.]|jgi:phospholipid-binding lipoprotein MlaA|nr:VacJ family lipoprotein [Fuscovulum sp.]